MLRILAKQYYNTLYGCSSSGTEGVSGLSDETKKDSERVNCYDFLFQDVVERSRV